jgi:hypothetical protein
LSGTWSASKVLCHGSIFRPDGEIFSFKAGISSLTASAETGSAPKRAIS